MDLKENFRHLANRFVNALSSHWSFLFFFALIIIWIGFGVWLNFSESWHLMVHISLAIVTFLMVLLIQHVQHRETRSMQIKLDELLKGVEGARNAFINIQAKPDEHLDRLQNKSNEHAPKLQDEINKAELKGESANDSVSDEPEKNNEKTSKD